MSESPKGQVIYQIAKAAMQHWHILSVCVCACVSSMCSCALSCSSWKDQSWTFLSHYISRLCMSLLSSFSFLGITVIADSKNSPTLVGKKTQQVTTLCVRLSLYPGRREHNPLRPEWTALGTIGLSVRHAIWWDYMCPHTSVATCTTSPLFESGWKISRLGSMNQPASQQCLHCARLNVTDCFQHLNVWQRQIVN